ncbi:hypothetical protein PHYSODRAFT_533734, partial [Phytophthora sojae]
MSPNHTWTKLAEFQGEDALVKFRWERFCCSAIFWVRTRWCMICPGDHSMAERRLRCLSPDCKGSVTCATLWKVHECPTSKRWIAYTNGQPHVRGDIACSLPPHAKVTREMRDYIQRMDENAVPPRLIWSNMLRAPEIPTPVLGFPTCPHVLRSVKYNRWLQGSKN